MIKRMSLPVTFEMTENKLDDDTLLFSRIKVCHSGLNLNNSTFSIESFEDAKESIKNRPVLAYIKKVDGEDKKDFAGHEIEMSFKDGEIVFTYLERPIGVVVENNNYSTEVDENGKTWVYVDAVIWKDYANEAIDIFEENPNKSVSMEIVVDEYEEENGSISIKKFRYTGITVLGDDVMPAMSGANIQVQFSEDKEDDTYTVFSKRLEDINSRLSEKFEEEAKDDLDESESKEEMKKEEDMGCDDKKKEYELTYRNKMEMAEKIVYDAYRNENTWAWVIDMTEETVIFEVEEQKYKATYSIRDSEMTIDLENKLEVFARYLTQEEINELEMVETNFASELRELNSELETVKEELDKTTISLKEYQAKEAEEIEAQRKADIDSVIEDFSKDLNGNEEFEVIKQSAYNYETSDKLETELLLIYAKLNRKGNTSKKKNKVFSMTSVKIEQEEQIQEKKSVYGEANKYFPNNKED